MSNHEVVVKRWLMLLVILPAILVGCDSSFPFERTRIVVQWTTGSEFNTAGFNLYRSDSPTGTYVKINAQLIPAAPDPVSGGRYEFVDKDVASGKTYYYQLEEVEYSGVATRHGPIIATASASFDWQIGVIVLGLAIGGLLLFLRRRTRPDSLNKTKVEMG